LRAVIAAQVLRGTWLFGKVHCPTSLAEFLIDLFKLQIGDLILQARAFWCGKEFEIFTQMIKPQNNFWHCAQWCYGNAIY